MFMLISKKQSVLTLDLLSVTLGQFRPVQFYSLTACWNFYPIEKPAVVKCAISVGQLQKRQDHSIPITTEFSKKECLNERSQYLHPTY